MNNETCTRLLADHEQIKNCQLILKTAQKSLSSLSNVLALAGNEVRLKIVYLLEEERELCPCDLADILNMSIPAVSQHLRKLKDGNIVETRKEGQTIFYSLTLKNMKILKPFFKHINIQTEKLETFMISTKTAGAYTGAGLLSAIAASLCCITPVIALLAGSSTIAANFTWLESARPYLLVLSVAVLAFAWYVKLKPTKASDIDCGCETIKKHSFIQSKSFLSIVTVFAILMMTFPLYAKMFYPKPKVQTRTLAVVDNKQDVKFNIQGMTCEACEEHVNNELSKVSGIMVYKTSYDSKSSLVTFDKSKVDVMTIAAAINKTGYSVKGYDVMNVSTTAVTFYKAPLVCYAAPSIGCGSKAKFILVDLEKHIDAVEGAWLNKTGTVVAVKWNTIVDNNKKIQILKTVGANHNIELTALPSTEATNYSASFANGAEWFRGEEVDKLSKEEAQIIAKNTIEGYKKDGLIKASFEKQFQADIAKIYEDLFLSIASYKDLTIEAYNKVEEQIQQAGEKYTGKGKMPIVELCVASAQSCEKDKSCLSGAGKSCCNSEKDQ